MRVKISASIIEKTSNKTNYTHETYSMILNHLKSTTSKEIHQKKKFFRLLTFTNICINKDQIHFYVAGEDQLLQEFIEHISFTQIIKIGDIVAKVTKIQELTQLIKTKNDTYKFKSKVIININKDGKTQLCNDFKVVEERLVKNSIAKAKELGYEGDIEIKLINPKHTFVNYKNGHVNSWRCMLEIKGDYDIVNTIYNVGIGENTASGHGFLWEV